MFSSKTRNNNDNKLCPKTFEELQNNPEYLQNQMQIGCITKVLVERADVPKKLIDWLIESVKENLKIEYGLYEKKT